MRYARFSWFVLGFILLAGAGKANAYTTFYVDPSPGDGEVVAGYVLNEFQQDVAASSGCEMTTDEKSADFIMDVVSIVDTTGDNGQNDSSAYSVTLTDGDGQYISSVIGICGSDKVASCGDDLYREMVHDLPSNVANC